MDLPGQWQSSVVHGYAVINNSHTRTQQLLHTRVFLEAKHHPKPLVQPFNIPRNILDLSARAVTTELQGLEELKELTPRPAQFSP